MAELSARELIDQWRQLLETLISAAASAAPHTELPQELLESSMHQLELMQKLFERERRLQGELAGRLLVPVDAVFDLLEDTGATLRRQAEALAAAGRALEETARTDGQPSRHVRADDRCAAPADRARKGSGRARAHQTWRRTQPRALIRNQEVADSIPVGSIGRRPARRHGLGLEAATLRARAADAAAPSWRGP